MGSKRITKKELISQISNKIKLNQSSGHLISLSHNDLHNLIGLIEESIYDNLKQATENESIIIALFEGLNIESSYIPQKEKVNNLTGQVILTSSKIKPKATFTRTCCEKLSESVR